MSEENRVSEEHSEPFDDAGESGASEGQDDFEAGETEEEAFQAVNGGENSKGSEQEDLPGEVRPRPVEDLEAELKEAKDAVLRARADFENFRKRMKREQSEISDRVAMALLGEILPVMDNFERAISTVKTADMESFSQGVQMILRQMTDVLEAQGVKRMTVEGAPFDPRVHEAVSVLESDEVREETCSAEVIPGYTYKYKVLRPAQVQVAKPKIVDESLDQGESIPVKGVSWRELHEKLGTAEEEDSLSEKGEGEEEETAPREGQEASSDEGVQ